MTGYSYEILKFLKKNNGSTAKEVGEALGMTKRRVDSYFSAAIAGEGLGERDQSVSPSKLVLNDKGMAYTQPEIQMEFFEKN